MKAKDITIDQFLKSCKSVVDTARTNKWRYGNSTTTPPCSDGIISCDRLIARALYNLGFKDQVKGGETCGTLDKYLSNHGFIRSESFNDMKKGSIVLVRHAGKNYWSHAFVCVDYQKGTFLTSRYDTGSNERIQSVQPLKNVSWGYRKDIVLVFNIPEQKKESNGHKLTQQGQRYLRMFMGTGGEPRADGKYTEPWQRLYIKGIQTALNKSFKCGLKVDGVFGEKTALSISRHPCEYGTINYLNSMLEIGFYLKNIDPKGYEQPGQYGNGITKAVEKLVGTNGEKAGVAVFRKLVSLE